MVRPGPGAGTTSALARLRSCAAAAAMATVTVLAAGCVGSDATREGEAAVESWTLGAPSVEIGTVEGETAYLLHQVPDAIRLADGRIAVLNAGSHEVRLYGADGTHLRSIGREGDGPGEFRSPARLRHRGGDTVAVVDEGLRRTTALTLEGEVVGTEELAAPLEQPFPAETWLFRRHWVDGGRPGRRAGVARILSELPPPDRSAHDPAPRGGAEPASGAGARSGAPAASYRYVKVAEDGRLWITPELPPWPDGTVWAVRDPDGSLLAEVETPPRFFPFRIDGDRVLGVTTDSLDVERVRVLPLRKPPDSPPGPGRSALLAPGPEPIRAEAIPADALASMRGLVRMMTSLQEMHYGRTVQDGGGSYATSLEALVEAGQGRLRLEIPEGSRAEILSADSRHWIGETVHEPTGTHCVMSMRAPRMVGVPPGRALCWVETPPESPQDAER